MSAWFVYLVQCRDGSIYTGIATDVDRRYAQHLAGKGARYTRANPPVQLLARFPHPDRASASRAEYAIKQFTPARKRALCEAAATPAVARSEPRCDPDASLIPAPDVQADVQTIDFPLDRDHVELNQLLKLVGVCDSGGAGKALVASGAVAVDGAVELRKTCKIRAGQVVTLDGIEIRVVAA